MISYVADILIILLLFTLFGISHSYLASTGFKEKVRKSYPDAMPFYRIVYNLTSLISLYILYQISPKPQLIIYDLKYPYDFAILIPQFLALGGIFWTAKYFCFKEFIGITQIQRYLKNEYDSNDLDEKLTLRIEGPYRYSRHPLYFFTILFLVSRPVMSLSYLVYIVCIIAYFYAGSFYEERKLLNQFGEDYKRYSSDVPRIVPLRLFSPYKG